MIKIVCNYDEIEKDYLEVNKYRTAGQYGGVAKVLIQEQLSFAKKNHLDYKQTTDHLDQILNFFLI